MTAEADDEGEREIVLPRVRDPGAIARGQPNDRPSGGIGLDIRTGRLQLAGEFRRFAERQSAGRREQGLGEPEVVMATHPVRAGLTTREAARVVRVSGPSLLADQESGSGQPSQFCHDLAAVSFG
jgi:hypothetical protein